MISIIIPVYNSVTVLPVCLQSILIQTYQNFEVLLIDDGSYDGSAALCDQYTNLDMRISVYHKLNGGVSSARNIGISNAQGEYITFIDSDDAIEPDYLEQLQRNFVEDLAICGFKITDGKEFILEADVITLDRMAKEVPIMVRDPFLLYSACGKLFRRELIEQHNLLFDTRLRLYEDSMFVLNYLSLCKSVRKQPFSGYLYNGEWGGVNKYILSLDDVEYRCQNEMLVLQRLEHTFACCINKSTRAYCVEYLDDLYGKYTDSFCIDMYLKFHPDLVRKDFLCNFYLYPSYIQISHLKRLYQQNAIVKGQDLMRKLCTFFTVPVNELYFGRKDEKLLYSLIWAKHLKLANFFLHIYSILKR